MSVSGGYSFLSFDLRMFLPVSRCASALIFFCLLPGLCAWFVIRLCGSTVDVVPFLPKNKKKIALLSSLVVVTIGVVTSTMSVTFTDKTSI